MIELYRTNKIQLFYKFLFSFIFLFLSITIRPSNVFAWSSSDVGESGYVDVDIYLLSDTDGNGTISSSEKAAASLVEKYRITAKITSVSSNVPTISITGAKVSGSNYITSCGAAYSTMKLTSEGNYTVICPTFTLKNISGASVYAKNYSSSPSGSYTVRKAWNTSTGDWDGGRFNCSKYTKSNNGDATLDGVTLANNASTTVYMSAHDSHFGNSDWISDDNSLPYSSGTYQKAYHSIMNIYLVQYGTQTVTGNAYQVCRHSIKSSSTKSYTCTPDMASTTITKWFANSKCPYVTSSSSGYKGTKTVSSLGDTTGRPRVSGSYPCISGYARLSSGVASNTSAITVYYASGSPTSTYNFYSTSYPNGANYSCTWSTSGTVHIGKCSVCGKNLTSHVRATSSTYSTYTESKAATCTTASSGTYKCKGRTATVYSNGTATTSTCALTWSGTSGSALGHSSNGTWVVGTEATCTTDGEKHTNCSRCGIAMNSTKIAALGHYYEQVPGYTVYPTLATKGLITYVCSHEGCTDSFTSASGYENLCLILNGKVLEDMRILYVGDKQVLDVYLGNTKLSFD